MSKSLEVRKLKNLLRWLKGNWDIIVVLFVFLVLPLAALSEPEVELDVESTKYALNITTLALSILLPLSFGPIARRRSKYPGFCKVWRSNEHFHFQAVILFALALLFGVWNISRFPTVVQEHIWKGTEARLTLGFGAVQFSCFILGLIRMIRSLGVLKEDKVDRDQL